MSGGVATVCVLLLLAAQPHAVVRVEAPPVLRLGAGERIASVLRIEIREGFKVQANPAADEYLIPLSLELPEERGVRLAETQYPEPGRHRLEGTSSDLLIYEGGVELRLEFEADEAAVPGEARLEGRLRHQACNARVCLRPASVPVQVAVELIP